MRVQLSLLLTTERMRKHQEKAILRSQFGIFQNSHVNQQAEQPTDHQPSPSGWLEHHRETFARRIEGFAWLTLE